jgi:xylulokinase
MYVAGLDFGTSGARIAVIDAAAEIGFQGQVAFPASTAQNLPATWLVAMAELWQMVPLTLKQDLGAIAINGTSATVLLCNAVGIPLTAPLLYSDNHGQHLVATLASQAPEGNAVLSATSSLVKLLWWRATLPSETWQQARYFLHQADWLALQLHGRLGRSDYHNALKLGYDVGELVYPPWLLSLGVTSLLPQVQAPGTRMGTVTPIASEYYGIPVGCAVIAGTTDSIAAFLASGARSPGETVTSLGSTLVIKLLSQTRVDNSHYGIYSHRLGDLWLVGGASNTGGAVLRHFFSDTELVTLSQQIPGDRPSGLAYYPLLQPGERFPISDPEYPPCLTPRPVNPAAFLHGLLEGIARIEALGYQRLVQLGATPPTRILTAGGGAQNTTWTRIRQHHLSAPVTAAATTDAAVGTAQLALSGLPANLDAP